MTGPATDSAAVGKAKLLNGQPAKMDAIDCSFITRCLTDSFTVTGSGGTMPPTICGTNTGEHGT